MCLFTNDNPVMEMIGSQDKSRVANDYTGSLRLYKKNR